jgi:hypothetical protein
MQHFDRGTTSNQTLLVTPTEQSSVTAQSRTNTRARVRPLPRACIVYAQKRKLSIDVHVLNHALFLILICCRIRQAPGPPVSKSRNMLDLAPLGLIQQVTARMNSNRPSLHNMNRPQLLLMASVRIHWHLCDPF